MALKILKTRPIRRSFDSSPIKSQMPDLVFMAHSRIAATLVLALALVLGGCEYFLATTAVISDNVTRDATGRSLSDRALEDWTDLDCRTINLQFGKPVCREPERPVGPTVYCYRGLAGPECFTAPDAASRPTTTLGATASSTTRQPR